MEKEEYNFVLNMGEKKDENKVTPEIGQSNLIKTNPDNSKWSECFLEKGGVSIGEDLAEIQITEEKWSPKNGFTFAMILQPKTREKEKVLFNGNPDSTSYVLFKSVIYSSDSYDTRDPTPLYLELSWKKAYPNYLKRIEQQKIGYNKNAYLVIYANLPSFYWFEFVDKNTFDILIDLHKNNRHDEIYERFIDLKHHKERIEKNAKRRKKK